MFRLILLLRHTSQNQQRIVFFPLSSFALPSPQLISNLSQRAPSCRLHTANVCDKRCASKLHEVASDNQHVAKDVRHRCIYYSAWSFCLHFCLFNSYLKMPILRLCDNVLQDHKSCEFTTKGLGLELRSCGSRRASVEGSC